MTATECIDRIKMREQALRSCGRIEIADELAAIICELSDLRDADLRKFLSAAGIHVSVNDEEMFSFHGSQTPDD